MKSRKAVAGVWAAVVSVLLVFGMAAPASAASYNAGAWNCPQPLFAGNKISTTSKTTGDTSHNVWTNINNNQGQWWPGDSAWRSRSFYSTKSSANAIHYTFTTYTQLGRHCYT